MLGAAGFGGAACGGGLGAAGGGLGCFGAKVIGGGGGI
jgi:hypothetical protein